MNLIWKIYTAYNKIAIDIILYIIFKAFTDMYLISANDRFTRITYTGRGIKMFASL